MPRNFTDKSLWNIANVGINDCNVSSLGEIDNILAAVGVSVNYGSQDDLGKRVVISDAEFAAGPSWYIKANGTLYGGVFQAVYIDPAATAANLTTGDVCFLKDNTNSLGADTGAQVYAVTDYSHADAVGLIAGVCLTPTVTPGNYTIIQVHGKVAMNFSATAPGDTAIGSAVVVDTATTNGKVTTLAAAATVSVADIQLYLGDNIAAAAANTVVPVQLKRLFGRY